MISSQDRPRVAVIGTGGTISFDGRDSLDTYEYMEFGTRREVAEVVGRFPEIGAAAELRFVDCRSLPSSAVAPADWLELAGRGRRPRSRWRKSRHHR